MKQFFQELKERRVFRVAIAYAAVAWVVAQVAEFALETFEAPSWVLKSLVVILALGLPIAVVLAWAFQVTPEGVKRDKGDLRPSTDGADSKASGSRSVRPVHGILVLIMLVGTSVSYIVYDRYTPAADHANIAQVVEQARDLTSQDRFGEAYAALLPWLSELETNAEIQTLLEDITVEIVPRVQDSEARVSFRPFETPDAPWVAIESDPDSPMRAPKGGLLLRVEKPGFASREVAVANPGPMLNNYDPKLNQYINYPLPEIQLYPEGQVPDDLVRIPQSDLPIFMSGFAEDTFGDRRHNIPAFDIHRYEVSNREFKEFVDAGGYSDPDFWQGILLIDGTPIDAETIAGFVDTTGRPGPSHWELGNYAEGAGDLPVGGISLYEARAYARFRGMALPTIHHWARAAYAPMEAIRQIAPYIAMESNYDNSGPLAVSEGVGIGPWGTLNMAGNAREWVWNTTDELGIALGGAWTNYDDMYQVVYTIDPMSRLPQNGLRLMHTLGQPVDTVLLDPIELNWDITQGKRQPVSDEVFEAMRFQYTHVRREVNSESREVVEENDSWVAEEVILNFADGEEFTLYTVVPRNATEGLQPVVYFPHSGAFRKQPNRDLLEQLQFIDYIVKAGRAVVIPVWMLSAQRAVPSPENDQAWADLQRRTALAWYQDAAITIDYLESRDDFDASKVGLAGFSFGAYQGGIPLAIENRFTTAVLISGGAPYWDAPHPMYDSVNYLPRVTLPVLMINGRHDHLFTYENSQLYMLDLLGTPDEHKKHLVFEEGHFDFPRNTVAREVSDWLDTYMGPVR